MDRAEALMNKGGKWLVRVSAGEFMAGEHWFTTKKAAWMFFYKWTDAASYRTNLERLISEPQKVGFPPLQF